MPSWVEPRTWTDNEYVSSTLLNIYLRDNLNFLSGLQLDGISLSELANGAEIRLRNMATDYLAVENSTNSTEMVQVGNSVVTLTTRGGPVLIVANFDQKTDDQNYILHTQLYNAITHKALGSVAQTNATEYEPSTLARLELVPAGTYRWELQYKMDAASHTGYVQRVHLTAFEIG